MKERIGHWHHRARAHPYLKHPYKVLVILAAIVAIIAGVLMLVLPGPGLLAIFFGFWLLSLEIPALRGPLNTVKVKALELIAKFKAYRQNRKIS